MLSSGQTSAPPAAVTAPAGGCDAPGQVLELNEKVDKVVEAQKKVLPSEFNPSIGFVGETVFSYRSQGKDKTDSDRPGGFDVFQRSVELIRGGGGRSLRESVCCRQRFSGIRPRRSHDFGIKEAAMQTTSLPWNLELKAAGSSASLAGSRTSTITNCRS